MKFVLQYKKSKEVTNYKILHWLPILVLAVMSACSSTPSPGVLDGPCRDDGTCNEGLVCRDDVCVSPDTIEHDADRDTDADSEADAWDGDVPDAEIDCDADARSSDIHDIGYRLHDEIESLVSVEWMQERDGVATVRYRIEREEWRETPPRETVSGQQEQLVLGIPYATDFSFQVVLTTGEYEVSSAVIEGRTGSLPPDFPLPELRESVPDAWDASDRYLLGSISITALAWTFTDGFYSFIVDRDSRVLWARFTPMLRCTLYSRVSHNGQDLLLDESSFWSEFDDGRESQIQRIKIDGSIVETYVTPGLHHPFNELPDGTIVWNAVSGRGETLEMLSPTGTQERLWDCAPFYLENGLSPERRCRSNALFWDPMSDSFFVSFFTGSFIVQIMNGTGEAVRSFGNIPNAYRFEPPESLFSWQHGVTITDRGTMMLTTHLSLDDFEGVVREYEFEDATRTLQQVWTWGEGNGVETHTGGEAHRLANGNTLINYGSSPIVREVTPAGEVVWEMGFEGNRMVGRTIYLEDLYDFAP